MFKFLFSNNSGFDIECIAPCENDARLALSASGENNLTLIEKTLYFRVLHRVSFNDEYPSFYGVLTDDRKGIYIDQDNLRILIEDLNSSNNPDFMAQVFDNEFVIYDHTTEEVSKFQLNDGYYFITGYVFNELEEVKY